MIQEIKSSDWPEFCQRLTQQRAGALVNLETFESSGIKIERVVDAELQSMVFDKTGACNDVITLRLRNTREFVYKILDPIRITLHPSREPGCFNPLQITGENGMASITLHPAINAKVLGDLKTP